MRRVAPTAYGRENEAVIPFLAVAADGALWLRIGDSGRLTSCAEVAELERSRRPRWVLTSAARVYPLLRRGGVRLDRCHDLAHAQSILDGSTGVRAAPVLPPQEQAPTLFGAGDDPDADPTAEAAARYAAQWAQLETLPGAAALRLLIAIDSVGALLAVEMTEAGIPWRVDLHERLLTQELGPRPSPGGRPARLVELAEELAAIFGRPVNPDSPQDVLAAFARDGVELQSTRKWALARVEHPAVPPLLRYKELSRLHTANGWAWLRDWVDRGRFRPGYLPAGVVTGRWAARGGGALQIPRQLRSAVVADPGRVLVVADAAQLEPRILAAMSGDAGMVRAAGTADMYAALAAEAFDGDRQRAKIGLLGAMYGQVGGGAARPLQVLRARYPQALQLLESAARTGERGGLVRTRLGRTSPPRSERDPTPVQERARGRFTRNFVVQGTAAEWAVSMLGVLRARLFAAYGDTDDARIVFFQHDEVIVHCAAALADDVIEHIRVAASEATRLLFGPTPVVFGLDVRAARTYAEAH